MTGARPPGRVLLVAATERELGGHEGLACGIGPVEAAAATAFALAADRPDAVLHVGIAGAAALPLRTLVVGTASTYVDLAAAIPVVSTAPPDERLVAAVRGAVPSAVALPIATSAAVGASGGADVEAMEGFGVLRACTIAGVPTVEVRVISNRIGEADRSQWDIPGALETLAEALPLLLAALVRETAREDGSERST